MMNSLTTLTGNHWGRIALLGLAALLVAVAALVFSGGGGGTYSGPGVAGPGHRGRRRERLRNPRLRRRLERIHRQAGYQAHSRRHRYAEAPQRQLQVPPRPVDFGRQDRHIHPVELGHAADGPTSGATTTTTTRTSTASGWQGWLTEWTGYIPHRGQRRLRLLPPGSVQGPGHRRRRPLPLRLLPFHRRSQRDRGRLGHLQRQSGHQAHGATSTSPSPWRATRASASAQAR